jgi:hypothetical protein
MATSRRGDLAGRRRFIRVYHNGMADKQETPKEPDEPRGEAEHVPFEDYGQKPPPEALPRQRRRLRRPSPLGLMGPSDEELPKESGLPSLRAAGIMALFIAVTLILVYWFTR